eukprot:m.356413 g.356413  ORF g.356413 m.356413 type:complete len:378 (-) comp16605_c0_seq8:3551-4684(-)
MSCGVDEHRAMSFVVRSTACNPWGAATRPSASGRSGVRLRLNPRHTANSLATTAPPWTRQVDSAAGDGAPLERLQTMTTRSTGGTHRLMTTTYAVAQPLCAPAVVSSRGIFAAYPKPPSCWHVCDAHSPAAVGARCRCRRPRYRRYCRVAAAVCLSIVVVVYSNGVGGVCVPETAAMPAAVYLASLGGLVGFVVLVAVASSPVRLARRYRGHAGTCLSLFDRHSWPLCQHSVGGTRICLPDSRSEGGLHAWITDFPHSAVLDRPPRGLFELVDVAVSNERQQRVPPARGAARLWQDGAAEASLPRGRRRGDLHLGAGGRIEIPQRLCDCGQLSLQRACLTVESHRVGCHYPRGPRRRLRRNVADAAGHQGGGCRAEA